MNLIQMKVDEIRTITANHYSDAKLSIRNVNEILGIHLFAEDVDPYTNTPMLERLLVRKWKLKDICLRSMDPDGYHIKYLEVKKS